MYNFRDEIANAISVSEDLETAYQPIFEPEKTDNQPKRKQNAPQATYCTNCDTLKKRRQTIRRQMALPRLCTKTMKLLMLHEDEFDSLITKQAVNDEDHFETTAYELIRPLARMWSVSQTPEDKEHLVKAIDRLPPNTLVQLAQIVYNWPDYANNKLADLKALLIGRYSQTVSRQRRD